MLDWKVDWKSVSLGGVITAIGIVIRWLNKKYDFLRMRPREAIEVKKVAGEIESGQVINANSITAIAKDFTLNLMTQVDKDAVKITRLEETLERQRITAEEEHNRREKERLEYLEREEASNDLNFKLQVEIMQLKQSHSNIENRMKSMFDDLADCLNMSKQSECEDRIKNLRLKYGI